MAAAMDKHGALGVERVAREYGMGRPDLVPAEIGHNLGADVRTVVVATIGSFNALAALARATTLCFSSPVSSSRTPVIRPTWVEQDDRGLVGR
jgi:hypothetical protein